MRARTPPIFCDHCACLALAVSDDSILCADCLLVEISSGGRVTGVRPLELTFVGTAAGDVAFDPSGGSSIRPAAFSMAGEASPSVMLRAS